MPTAPSRCISVRPHARRAAPATGMGFNPYGLRTASALWQDSGLEAAEDRRQLPVRHHAEHHALDADDATGTSSTRRDIAEYKKNPESVHEGAEDPPRELTHVPGVEVRRATRGAWRSI